MPIQLITQDNYSISDAPVCKNKLDQFYDISKAVDEEGKKNNVLNIVIDATRSGSIVNRRMYEAVSVERKYKRFITPNMKPVMKNHDQHDVDATIGRVTDSTFERLAKLDDQFYNDFKYAKEGSQGSGRVMLDVAITDEDAQAKILDQRYMTVSTGQDLSTARCSHCDMNWADKRCDHFPGEMAALAETSPFVKTKSLKAGDKAKVFLIAGIDDYREVSFVNVPAQQLAKVTKIKDSFSGSGLSATDLSRLCDVFITNAYTRSKDCVYDTYMQDASGYTQSLLPDDYRDHIRKIVTGKTTVQFSSPAVIDHDLSDNKNDATSEANKEKVVPDTTDVNNKPISENTMADAKTPLEISTDAVNALTKTNTELLAKVKEATDKADASKAAVDALNAEKVALLKAVADSQAKMLLTMRKVYGHLDVATLNDAAKETAYLDALKARSIESLKDAVADEMGSFLKTITDLKTDTSKLASKAPIDNPANTNDEKKPAPAKGTPVKKNDIL